jgi:AcrR family transcriptional regulator
VIEAALIEFGKGGYEGTSTSVIAERAGIQQPYIYAIFTNKSELFLACHEALNERLLGVYREQAKKGDSPAERLGQMRAAYRQLLEDDAWAQCQLQVLAAGRNNELRRPIRKAFDRLFRQIVEISGASETEVARFFATTTMVSAMTAIGEPAEMIDHLTLPLEEEMAA